MKPVIIGCDGRVGQHVHAELGMEIMPHGLCFDKNNADTWPDSFKGMTVFLCVPGSERDRLLGRVLQREPKSVVDVTFCKNPLVRPEGVPFSAPVLVDAGFAPGLANVLLQHLSLKGCVSGAIRVGGMPANPNINEWKHAVSWNANDHLDEYVRTPIYVYNGEAKATNSPLYDTHGPHAWRHWEMMRTDGLRTLVRNAAGLGYEFLEEWTVRWPGFYDRLRRQYTMGRRLPALANEWEYPEPFDETVVLSVWGSEAITRSNPHSKKFEWFFHQTGRNLMARVTAASMVGFAEALDGANLEPGIFTPELLAEINPRTLQLLQDRVPGLELNAVTVWSGNDEE